MINTTKKVSHLLFSPLYFPSHPHWIYLLSKSSVLRIDRFWSLSLLLGVAPPLPPLPTLCRYSTIDLFYTLGCVPIALIWQHVSVSFFFSLSFFDSRLAILHTPFVSLEAITHLILRLAQCLAYDSISWLVNISKISPLTRKRRWLFLAMLGLLVGRVYCIVRIGHC